MKRLISLLALLLSITFVGSQALAATLDFVPSSQTVKLGSEVVVYLHVSGLTPGTSFDPAVGRFDIDVLYGDLNQTLIFDSVVIGPQLGDPNDSSETDVSFQEYEGFVWVAEESLLSPAELDALQGRAVTLVTLKFRAYNVGSVTIGGDLYSLKDQFGNNLLPTFGPVGLATVNVVKGKKNLPPSLP